MRNRLKRICLFASRSVGLFALARQLTRRRLRILCYHGFAIGDEARFRPGLFIERRTFARRIDFLTRKRFAVLSLEEAIQCLDADRLPGCATVLTVDDGFYGTSAALTEHLLPSKLPATVYVTSYYAEKGTPIFRLVVWYCFWKRAASFVDLEKLNIGLNGRVCLSDGSDVEPVIEQIVEHGERQLDEGGRQRLAEALCRALNVDYDELIASRRFNLMNPEEIQALQAQGVDIQLHTHRHRLPLDERCVSAEIADNRRWLAEIASGPLEHFCYPSGEWAAVHLPWLASHCIKSAVTCDPGLNDRDTPRLLLRRFLDGEDISQIEFEAEMSGFLDLLRRAREAWCRRWPPARSRPAPASTGGAFARSSGYGQTPQAPLRNRPRAEAARATAEAFQEPALKQFE